MDPTMALDKAAHSDSIEKLARISHQDTGNGI
jgi:hypothetical protein